MSCSAAVPVEQLPDGLQEHEDFHLAMALAAADGHEASFIASEEGTRINTALAGRKPQGQSVPISVGEQRSKRSGTLKRLRVNGGTKKKPKTLQHKRLIQ